MTEDKFAPERAEIAANRNERIEALLDQLLPAAMIERAIQEYLACRLDRSGQQAASVTKSLAERVVDFVRQLDEVPGGCGRDALALEFVKAIMLRAMTRIIDGGPGGGRRAAA
jgi:hypothetical protein